MLWERGMSRSLIRSSFPAKLQPRTRRLARARILLAALIGAAAISGVSSYALAGHQTTDDAAGRRPRVERQPRVAGQVKRVLIKDNQQGRQRRPRRADDRDYAARLAAAKADVVPATPRPHRGDAASGHEEVRRLEPRRREGGGLAGGRR